MLETRKESHRKPHPLSELPLARPAARVLAERQERRRQVVVDLEVTLELLLKLREEIGQQVQASDLVLILVRHQLEQRARDSTRYRFGLELTFGLAHALDD